MAIRKFNFTVISKKHRLGVTRAICYLGGKLLNSVAQDDWDFANDLRLYAPEISEARENLASSTRKFDKKLQFKSMGNTYTMDIIYNNDLFGKHINAIGKERALIGKNLRVTFPDGKFDFVETPLARFIVQDGMAVQGGFEYKEHFYQLSGIDYALLDKEIGGKAASRKSADDAIVVARRALGELTRGPQGQKYRCGTDKLDFNRKQSGSTTKSLKGKKDVRGDKENKGDVHILSVPRKARDEAFTEVTKGCPVKTKQLAVAIVADCNYVKALGGRVKARNNILSDLNLVSGIYLRTFNIDLVVDSVELLDQCDSTGFNVPCKNYPGLDSALNSFSQWRDNRPTDVTSCNYSDTVGLAWVNQVCRVNSFVDSQADTVSGTSVTVAIQNQFSIIAHEMAHNLGAIHDCASFNCDGPCTDLLGCQCCPCGACNCKGKFIMDPESGGASATEFSSCAIQDVCDKLAYLGSCLKEQGTQATDLIAVCGNGIREGSEECDCGGKVGCAKTDCCTIDCKLTSGSQCYDGNDNCCDGNCNIISATANQVCRAADSECQDDAVCDGKSRSCPNNPNLSNGKACSNGQKCASGICTSRDLQCSIFGRHLQITNTCPYTSRSCSVICNSPNECVDLNANFVDGTPCGQSGFCNGGMCSEFGSSTSPNDANDRNGYNFSWATVVFKAVITGVAFIATSWL